MAYFLIGSRAVHEDILKRTPKDWDVIDTDAKEYRVDNLFGERTEIYPGSFLNNDEICEEYKCCTPSRINGVKVYHIALKGLAILKRSHLHRPLNFPVHIRDYHNIKEVCGEFNERDLEILSKRTKLTKKEFKDRTPSLNKSNEEFFDDYVKKYYIHDEIHEVVAYYERPLYERLKVDQSKALCQKDLWEQLSHEDKVKCVQEEAYVIALERFIIPNWIEKNKNYPPKFAFHSALEKICTTLTSGYFRDFAIDNWPVVSNYELNFVERFKNAGLPQRKFD